MEYEIGVSIQKKYPHLLFQTDVFLRERALRNLYEHLASHSFI